MASSSRDFTIDWDATEIADVRSKSFNYTSDLVDVTTDDDDGWATFLAQPGRRGLTVSISGVAEDESVLADAIAATVASKTAILHLPSTQATPGNITGLFLVTNFSYEGSASDDTVEFSIELQSTGSQAYTASAV